MTPSETGVFHVEPSGEVLRTYLISLVPEEYEIAGMPSTTSKEAVVPAPGLEATVMGACHDEPLESFAVMKISATAVASLQHSAGFPSMTFADRAVPTSPEDRTTLAFFHDAPFASID